MNTLTHTTQTRCTLHAARCTLHAHCRGQIATLLTLAIALGLMFTMAATNVGKVALFRTNTSNAADAGALAAVSWLSSADNAIKQLSTDMFEAYVVHFASQVATFFYPYPFPALGYAFNAAFAAGQFARYVYPGIKDGNLAHDRAKADAVAYAQANSGMGPQERGQFIVQVGNVPTPTPIPIVGPVVFFSCEPPFTPSLASCCILGCMHPPCCLPPTPWPDAVLAFIVDIAGDEGTVSVTTTRTQPDADLRLWTMRYGAVTSSATGWYGGGSPAPFGGSTYKARLEAVQ